jgi:hypothetical protein
LRKISISTAAVTTLAGKALQTGSADGTGAAASFASYASGIAVDISGTVYVADTLNCTIRKITSAGVVTTLAGLAGTCGSDDGTGVAARFDWPESVAVGPSGNVYVADSGNMMVRKITPAGVVTTLAGSPGGYGDANGTGAAAQFSYFYGIAVDSSENVFVADSDFATIRKITPAGVVTTFAGTSSAYGSADGTGSAARFDFPTDLAIDGSDNIYVVDDAAGTVRKITSAGVVSTLAGTPYVHGQVDGTGAAARFGELLTGITADTAGNVYLADTDYHTVRKITSLGVVTTVVGVSGFDGLELGPLPAKLSGATDVSVANGILYLLQPGVVLKAPAP